MSHEAWVALLTTAGAVTLFVSRWIPLAATAAAIPVVLAATGVLTAEQSLRGFGNQAVIALAAILLLGAGLRESGVATIAARGLERLGGRSPARTIVVIMAGAAVLSGFMSNTATVAIFLPAVAVLSRRTGIPPSRLFMPLAFGAIFGATLTMIGTTPNLILANDLRLRTGTPLGMFEFSFVGIPVVIAGTAFMAAIGWRLLPDTRPKRRPGHAERQEQLAETYGLKRKLFHVGIDRASPLIGQTIRDIGPRRDFELDVVLVLRAGRLGRRSVQPSPGLALAVGDVLYVEGEHEDVARFSTAHGLIPRLAESRDIERLLGRGVTLAEVTLAPRSQAIGKTLLELDFRKKHGLTVVSLWRGESVTTAGLGDERLELGDALLVSGTLTQVRALAHDADFLVLGSGGGEEEDAGRAPLALLLLAVALMPPLLGWMPLALSGMGAALLMMMTGVLSPRGARQSVDYTILLLVIGTIPLGIALDQSGVAGEMAGALRGVFEHGGAPGLIACLFLLSALLSTTTNNAAAAVILAPVAAQVAGADTIPIARAYLAVAMGASCTFILPFAHACNLMVMGPAGYATRDFVRVGSLLTLVMSLVAVLVLVL